jgi:hypothetical protein
MRQRVVGVWLEDLYRQRVYWLKGVMIIIIFRYLDSNGNPVDLEDGDEVLIQDLSGELNLYNFNGSGYELYYDSEDDFADVCTGNDQEYYFWNVDQYQQTEILNVNDLGGGDYLISGVTFDDVFIDIYLSDGLGNFLFETSGTWEEFEGAGIPFNSGGSDVVQVRPRTVNCEDLVVMILNRWELEELE